MKPRIVIRTEVGGEYGLGHATRCLALAKTLAARGADVEFLTATRALAAFVAPFECHCPADPTENEMCMSMLGWEPDIAVFDSKAPFAEDLYPLIRQGRNCLEPTDHKTTIEIVRIDHPHATPGTCNLLIGPGDHWAPETVRGLQAAFGLRFLYGWDYVMLDDEVTSHAPLPYPQRQEGPIVFCAGGSDEAGTLRKVQEWILDMPRSWGIEKLFAYGRDAQGWHEQVSLDYAWRAAPFARHHLREAALVVSMFGQTCYEALWYQTPLLMFSHTDENDWGAFYLGRRSRDAARRLGPLAAHTAETFATTLLDTWDSTQARPCMHAAATGLMDGQGLARIATAILELL